MSAATKNPCKVANMVHEHLTSHDEPYNYRETLEYFFYDAIGGVSFDGASAERRTIMYMHYKQMAEFFEALGKT